MLADSSIENDIKNLKSFIENYWTTKSSLPHFDNLNWNSSYFNGTNHSVSRNQTTPVGGYEKEASMNDGIDVQNSIKQNLILLETKHWLDLMTLTVDGTIFFINLILSCYIVYRICNVVNSKSNDVVNSLILHKTLIGIIIGTGFTVFDVFLIFSTNNNPLYKLILRKIDIKISWSSLCFLKLNFGEIMITCYLYYIIIILIVISKNNIIPPQLNRQWKIFLAFLHGIPWIIVFLVQLLLYIVATFQEHAKVQHHKSTTCMFLFRNNFFSLLFESLLILFPLIFAFILIVIYLVQCPSLMKQSDVQTLISGTENNVSDNHISNKFSDGSLKPADIQSRIVLFPSPSSPMNDSQREESSGTDKPLIFAVSVLLIACRFPVVISRLIMNVYWISGISAKYMHFVSAICVFINLCLFSLHPLLVLIYIAWRDGSETTLAHNLRVSPWLNNSYISVNNDESDEVPLQGSNTAIPDNLKYMMTSV